MPNRKQFNSNEAYNEWYRNYRENNRIKIREYNRQYNKSWRKLFGYNHGWDKKNPLKIKAEKFLQYAVKIGKVKKCKCEVCGSFNVHAHHDDYSKPLDVRWLCPLHHKQHHILLSTPLA